MVTSLQPWAMTTLDMIFSHRPPEAAKRAEWRGRNAPPAARSRELAQTSAPLTVAGATNLSADLAELQFFSIHVDDPLQVTMIEAEATLLDPHPYALFHVADEFILNFFFMLSCWSHK